jgi:hypothetical protein
MTGVYAHAFASAGLCKLFLEGQGRAMAGRCRITL